MRLLPLLSLPLALVLSGCSFNSAIPTSYTELMTGMWAHECESADGYCRYDVYMPDGRMHVFGFTEQGTETPEDQPYAASAKWYIDDFRVCYEITASNTGALVKGDKWCDSIKMLNSETLRLEASREVATATFTRL